MSGLNPYQRSLRHVVFRHPPVEKYAETVNEADVVDEVNMSDQSQHPGPETVHGEAEAWQPSFEELQIGSRHSISIALKALRILFDFVFGLHSGTVQS